MKLRIINLTLVTLGAAMLSGCLSMSSYVDPTLPPARSEDVTPVASPAPIQLLYEFRSKGVSNARATGLSVGRVNDIAKQSKLFSEVSDMPVANQRRLTIVLSNVAVTSEDDAKAKGVGVGLTFGLVGTMVTDGYECEATYTAAGAVPVKFSFKHALHSTIGNASGPPGLVGTSPKEAFDKIVDQLVWSIMRDLSKSGRL